VLRHPVALPALALLALALPGAAQASAPDVLVLNAHGKVVVRQDRFLPPAGTDELPPPGAPGARATTTTPPAPARSAVVRATIPSRLRALERAGKLSDADAKDYAAAYAQARRTVKRLKGVGRAELASVLRNAEGQAADGLLTSSRVKVVLMTVKRNAQWFAANGPAAYGRRMKFDGSRLVWQFYPGQGVQIQWLGTFGRMNQLFLAKGYDTELAAMAREIESYGVRRAGGIAWEYQFVFGGGRPPWVSGLAQGTGIQTLSRAAVRLKDTHWFDVARSALGIFRTPPPSGVRVKVGDGAHYLAYSYAPGQRIYNAFLQSVIGLHDFAFLANDPLGRKLYLEGERVARVEVLQADTGSWSLYQPGVQSDIGYHKVLRDFTRGLCSRLNVDRERAALRLRARTGDPGAVLHAYGSYPDSGPFCVTQQHLNHYLYARLKALGLPGPWS